MKKRSRKIIYILKYLMTILTWSFLVFLFLIIGLLGYYFYSAKVYEKKGAGYEPLYSIYTIVSPSMVPTINVYDMIINFKVNDPGEVHVSDIITFKSSSAVSKDLVITHRVNNIQIVNDEYEYVTKGDNNNSVDPSPALYKNVIGRTVFTLPGFGKIQVFLTNGKGIIALVVLPSLLLIISNISKIIKFKRIKEDSDRANKKLVKSMEK